MALTGIVLVLFVLLHMLGNLQVFAGPRTLNAYAHSLQTLPPAIKWGGRLFLLGSVLIHIWMAVVLSIENRRARPDRYEKEGTVQATYASRTMFMSGIIVLSFIVFHILHFTVRVVFNYDGLHYDLGGVVVHDVYSMMILGFKHWWVSVFYIISMGLLCAHLFHGVSSLVQTMGLRNESWRTFLDRIATAYGVVVFAGFAAIPVAVLAGIIKPLAPH